MEAGDSKVDSLMRGEAEVRKLMFAFADTMTLRCAVELRIADIINSHGGHATMSQLASSIGAASSGAAYLARITRLLVRNNVFSVDQPSDGGEPLYGLTDVSKWLIHGSDLSLAPDIMFVTHPLSLPPWHMFGQSVKDGGMPFEKAHGCPIWDFASNNPEFNRVFNDGMACTNPIVARGIGAECKDVFGSIASLVDVGGGTGTFLAEIIKLYPHIRGINFDLPHVIATAPQHPGITHVEGNMFETIPNADALVLKGILHDWGDEDCIKILKNCRKSINIKTGKLIICGIVLELEEDHQWYSSPVVMDLLMMALVVGGVERTERQLKKILKGGGFPNYKIIKLPTLPSIIEAYPA